MKVLFLLFHGLAEHNGITKKIGYQVDALRSCGAHPQLCYHAFDDEGNNLIMVDHTVLKNFGRGKYAKLSKRICYGYLIRYIIDNGIDIVYMRYAHNADPFIIRFARKLRRAGVKLLIEIPTYPYDDEYRGTPLLFHARLYFEKLFRRTLGGCVYRIVTFSDHKKIYGARTINISNGIDFDRIPIKGRVNDTSERLNLIAVAEIHFWHAFDRAIVGLAEYYMKDRPVEVIMHIVGKQYDDAIDLKALAHRLGVTEYVVFHGQMSGQELDDLFDSVDMGVASLGRHRSNITHIKTLKNREYAARGIPFVYSEIDDDFEKMAYVMKAPADETPLDVSGLVDFYRQAPHSPQVIRDTVSKTLSWKIQMKRVIDSCK